MYPVSKKFLRIELFLYRAKIKYFYMSLPTLVIRYCHQQVSSLSPADIYPLLATVLTLLTRLY